MAKILSNILKAGSSTTPLPVTNGGTGSTSTAYCLLTTNVTGTLPVTNGGTGSTSTAYCLLTTNVTGTLPVTNGGTGVTTTPTAGGIVYGNGTTIAYTPAGTTGQVLTSAGASAPTWVDPVVTGPTVAKAYFFSQL